MGLFDKIVLAAGQLGMGWVESKAILEQRIPFDSGWIHLVVGPVIFLAAAFVLRKPLASWWPWLIVLLLETLNEILDLTLNTWVDWTLKIGESISDLLLTMCLPTLILVAARIVASSRANARAPDSRS